MQDHILNIRVIFIKIRSFNSFCIYFIVCCKIVSESSSLYQVVVPQCFYLLILHPLYWSKTFILFGWTHRHIFSKSWLIAMQFKQILSKFVYIDFSRSVLAQVNFSVFLLSDSQPFLFFCHHCVSCSTKHVSVDIPLSALFII